MAAFTTIALTSAALIGGLATAGSQIYAGEEAKKSQKAARKQQEAAQDEASSRAASQRRDEQQANRKANRQSMMGLDSIVRAARTASPAGGKTNLTGGLGGGGIGQATSLGGG